MKKAGTWTNGRMIPGELMLMVGDRLSGHGFRVEYPDDPESRRLTLTSAPAALRTELSVQDTGDVQWEFPAPENGDADPRKIADIATVLLMGEVGPHKWKGHGEAMSGITFKGIVGLELKARGLDVELEIIRDDSFFDASAEIVVTGGCAGGESWVSVNDDGAITWATDYWPDYGVHQREPQCAGWLAEKETIARDIADTVKRAVHV